MREQIKAMEAANPKVDIAKQLEEITKAQQAAAVRTAAIGAQRNAKSRKPIIPTDQMIKYP
jgi:hypothetical protein